MSSTNRGSERIAFDAYSTSDAGVRAFVEAPAGLASVSLRLHGGPHCRPPISRIGNKAGYAEAILGLAGLRSGQSAGAFVWAEADADVRGLLRAYPDAAMLRRVADIIRGWADEEPRALWERLRAERKARGPVADDAGVAGWLYLAQTHHESGTLNGGFVHPEDGGRYGAGRVSTADRCTTLAEYAQLAASNRLINIGGPMLENTGKGGTTFGGEAFATPAGETAEGFERLAANVAAHAFVHQGSFQYKGEDYGIGRPEGMEAHDTHGAIRPVSAILADSFPRLASGWPPVAVLPSIPTAAELSAMLGTPGDLQGVVYYADPPYAPLPAVIAPAWPAFGLPMNVVFRAERRSALFAHGLDDFGCHVEDMPMMLAEVLRTAAGQKFEVVESIVELVTVLVVDDLIWRKWASDVSLYDQAVLHDVASVVADHPIAVLKPSLPVPRTPERREALDLVGHLRDLPLFRKAAARAAAQFGQAWAGADEAWAALGRSVARHELGTADLARHLERHVLTLREVRQGIARKYVRPTRNITGYAASLPREAVVRAALDAAAMGALVMVSEAVAVEELVAHGWHAVDIGHARRGQKRTFARVATEYVTMNRRPVKEPPKQLSLFA